MNKSGVLDTTELAVAFLKTIAASKTYSEGNVTYELRGDPDLSESAFTQLHTDLSVNEKVIRSGTQIGVATRIISY